jgi:ferredoxin--NADP+ reductase
MQIYWLKIKQIIQESSDVRTYLLERPEDFTWEEGAHTHLAMKGFNSGDMPNRSLVRHMSISTLPRENVIGITTRIRPQCSEYKSILRDLQVGDEAALFKTHSNMTLRRENKNIYLLSAGVGLATFRPIVLKYFDEPDHIPHVHALNIDSSKEFLFTDIFTSSSDRNFTAQFVDNRQDYYQEVKKLAADKEGIFYIVGSDDFLRQNIDILLNSGIQPQQIKLDKRERELPNFLPIEAAM